MIALLALTLGATTATACAPCKDVTGAAGVIARAIFGNPALAPAFEVKSSNVGRAGTAGRGDDDEEDAKSEDRSVAVEAKEAAREAIRKMDERAEARRKAFLAAKAEREAARIDRETSRMEREARRRGLTIISKDGKKVLIGPDGIVIEGGPHLGITPPAPPVPPVAPVAPVPPVPPRPPGSGSVRLRKFSLQAKDAPAVEVLHRIAQSAGWTLTVSGLGDDRVDIDVTDVDPRDAVRRVLKASNAWGVLRGDRLFVIPAGEDGFRSGELVERRRTASRSGRSKNRGDVVRVLRGDLVIERGSVVGDAVVIGGNLVVDGGALVQGDAVAVGGSITVEPGGMVMGDGVSVLGSLDIEPGGQVLGENVQVGAGKIFKKRAGAGGWFGRAGLFGFFPTLAFFALVYLVGLLALFAAPDRLRGIGATLLAHPVRSLAVGFLSWLLVVPLLVLLVVTIVGIPLVPLVPLALFLSFALGLSSLALRIGELLPAGPGQKFIPTAALGMGMAVVALASFVPVIGFAAIMLVQFAAVGAVVGSKVGKPPLSTVPREAQAA